MMEISIIATVSKNRVISKDGSIPWHSSDELRREELKHFKRTTIGKSVIMGRGTYESIGKPLEHRLNVVLSNTLPEIDGIKVCRSFNEAVHYCKYQGYEKAFVIGGRRAFEEAIPFTNNMVLTEIRGEYDGDTFFPAWSDEDWSRGCTYKYKLFDVVTYWNKNQQHI